MSASRLSRPLWPKMPKLFVRQMLDAHKVLGLALSAVLYLICLTGTIVVYFVEIERWEKPNLPEFTRYEASAAAHAVADMRQRMLTDQARTAAENDLYVAMPGSAMPRMVGVYGEVGVAYDAKGRAVGSADHDLTHFLTELHYYLHLPNTFGMIVVCLFGVGMMGLLVGGALAHPKMFQEAFSLRVRRQGQLSRVDVHNRLGTWTLPFGLAITLTGSVIGLAQVVGLSLGMLVYDGNPFRAYEPLFGSEAELMAAKGDQPLAGQAAVTRAIDQIRAHRPDHGLRYIILHNVGKETEALEIMTRPPFRLVFGETWRFDAQGNLKNSHGLSDGPAAKQVAAGIYGLHFGDFGGQPVKFLYALLGLGLCIMIAAGMDIWLIKSASKGRPHPHLHRLWVSFVYGVPIALCLAMASALVLPVSVVGLFWCLLGGICLLLPVTGALTGLSVRLMSRCLWLALGLSVLAVPAAHSLVWRSTSIAALQVNLPLVVIGAGIVILTLLWSRFKPASPATTP